MHHVSSLRSTRSTRSTHILVQLPKKASKKGMPSPAVAGLTSFDPDHVRITSPHAVATVAASCCEYGRAVGRLCGCVVGCKCRCGFSSWVIGWLGHLDGWVVGWLTDWVRVRGYRNAGVRRHQCGCACVIGMVSTLHAEQRTANTQPRPWPACGQQCGQHGPRTLLQLCALFGSLNPMKKVRFT